MGRRDAAQRHAKINHGERNPLSGGGRRSKRPCTVFRKRGNAVGARQLAATCATMARAHDADIAAGQFRMEDAARITAKWVNEVGKLYRLVTVSRTRRTPGTHAPPPARRSIASRIASFGVSGRQVAKTEQLAGIVTVPLGRLLVLLGA